MSWVEQFECCTVQALFGCTFLSYLLSACCSSRNLWQCLSSLTVLYLPVVTTQIHMSVLCVLVCAGRFTPVAVVCTNILKFLTNCSFVEGFPDIENKDF